MTLSPHIAAAVARLTEERAEPLKIAEALVDLATDLQRKPKSPQQLVDAVLLYERAASFAEMSPLGRARAIAGKATALRGMPGSDAEHLLQAKAAFEDCLPVLRAQGDADEVAEAELTYGVVLQTLAGGGIGTVQGAIHAYQRALRTFGRHSHPREFALLHNNLATAYLSMPVNPEGGVVREALAVSSFREALAVVTIEEDPVEFAMLQNNLGNALQSVQSSHPWENLRRAVEAYDEALRVRTRRDMPVEHGNTLANKANALMNLPDDDEHPEDGNPKNLAAAVALLEEAGAVFQEHWLADRAEAVRQLAAELAQELR